MAQREVSGWAVGWTWFAAVMMWLIGAWHAVAGLVGIVNDEFYAVTPEYTLQFDVTTWGWVYLVAGIVVFIAGIYLWRLLAERAGVARTIGVIVTGPIYNVDCNPQRVRVDSEVGDLVAVSRDRGRARRIDA